MKKELATAIFAAVAGAVIAFFITNLFLGPIEDVSFKSVEGSFSTTLDNPDPEVFNYKALNPTVEVYVGDDCQNLGENGECLDAQSTTQENE